MLFLKKSLLIIVLSALTVVSASASYSLVLQSGHDGSPVAMEWHSLSSAVVSVGEDGRLIVTRPRDNRVLHRFRVTDDQILDMKSDPSGNRAAIVTTDGNGYTLSVWNWTEEKMDFNYELESEPLFLSWSARGRYLIIGNLGSPSVVILEGRTGRRLSYLQRLPSLYNAAYIGSTENILMTYASSGEIRYWDIRSSALKLSETTTGGLESISVLQSGSKSSMIGHRLESVYLINRLTGEVLDQVEIPGLTDLSVDEERGELDVLSSGIAGSAIYQFDVVDDRFVPRNGNLSPRRVDSGLRPTKILRRGGTTYFSTETGMLFSDKGLDFTPLINDNVWRPDDLAFQGNSIYLAGGRTIRKFTSDFFAEDSKGRVESLNELIQEEGNSESGAQDVGLETMSNGDIIVWDKSDGGNNTGIRRLDFNRTAQILQISTGGPLQKVSIIDNQRLLAVDRNGTVSVIDSSDGEVLSTYSALGILDAAYSSEGDYLLTGRSSAGRSGTPLEVVDIRTRETVPIPDDRFMIYRVVRDTRGIYTVGVSRNTSGSSETSLVFHEPDRPDRARTVIKVPGEDLDAVVLPQPSSSAIYTSLGGTVQKISGNRRTTYEWNEPIKGLGIRGNVLYGIDDDGALAIWNADSGRLLLNVYLFEDEGWIAMPPEGEMIWASPGAINNVIIYRDGRLVDPRRISRTVVNTSPDLM